MIRRPALVLLALALLVPAVFAQPLLRPRLGPDESANPKPWELSPAADEAAAKIAFHQRAERWATDPTANQLALDARYYDLAITVDPVSRTVTGVVQARFTVTDHAVTAADLNLADALVVDGVTSGGIQTAWAHGNEVVSITLDRTYQPGETVSVTAAYHGTPPDSYGAFGFNTQGGQPLIWTLSEPFGARSWWPCDDWSDDKADSVDMHVTVPAGLIVASNGSDRGVTHNGATDTYHWHESYPISTYLVSMAIHPYSVWSDYYRYSPTDSMEVRFFIYPSDVGPTNPVNLMTVPMIAYYAGVYGEYPFLREKYGHAEFPWGGAMEHQTCTSIGAFYETIVCHELSHQWWGDMVTCADFHHVWLNEGFATYSEALWLEHAYGPEGYWGKMASTRFYGAGSIYVPDLNDWNRIFDSNLSYNKASWVLHMLRHAIGDAAFFQTLADYRQAFEYGAARTEDFQAIAEAASGMDLNDFFQQWIYGEYFPYYSYQWTCAPSGSEFTLNLTIDQIQTNTGLFHMPIDIRVEYQDGSQTTFVVDNALAHEEYALTLPAQAKVVYLDPDEWILKRVAEPIVDPTFDRGVLLVNGVDWATYGTEMNSACEARAFWGNLPISFWDCFPEPSGGYPSTLPAPLGHGRVPASVLAQFGTVIWLGNNYNGDLTNWLDTSILAYLQAGGNVLLMTRMGDSFLDDAMRNYLGITIASVGNVYDCLSVYPPLTTIGRLGTQSLVAVFNALLTQPTSTLLYIADVGYNPNPGIGVWRHPAGGGWANPHGGHFAFLSGRPYRWAYADLSANVERIVLQLFGAGSAVPDGQGSMAAAPALRVASPALGSARLDFSLPRADAAELLVYDAQGRLVRRLLAGACRAGGQNATWDGRGGAGETAPSGLYYARLRSGASTCTAPFLLLR